MQSSLRPLTLVILVVTLCLPSRALRAQEDPPQADIFAAAISIAGAIPAAKTRGYTLERIALAWARTDLCTEALSALRAGSDVVGTEAALDAALICAETVAGETAHKLLTFARGRINQETDPLRKGLALASLARAYDEMESEEKRDQAAALAAATLPATCDNPDTDLSAEDKLVAIIAVSALRDALGDGNEAKRCRILAASLLTEIEAAKDRARAMKEAARLLAGSPSSGRLLPFLATCAEAAPAATRAAFVGLVYSGDLGRSRAARSIQIGAIQDLTNTLSLPDGDADRFRAAMARTYLRLGGAVEAAAIVAGIKTEAVYLPVTLQLLQTLPDVAPSSAADLTEALPDAWKAAALLRDSDPDAAALSAARKLAIEVPDGPARNALLAHLGRQYLRAGDSARAVGLGSRMTGKSRDRLLWWVAMRQIDAGTSQDALKTVDEIKAPGYRARALAELALRMGKAGASLDAEGAVLLQKLAP